MYDKHTYSVLNIRVHDMACLLNCLIHIWTNFLQVTVQCGLDCISWSSYLGHLIYRYTIVDLQQARKYNVSMIVKVCFEAADDNLCLYSVDVFSSTLLPKRICNWEADFSQPGVFN